jgi:hypothetical protein
MADPLVPPAEVWRSDGLGKPTLTFTERKATEMTATVCDQVGDFEPSLADITERLFSQFEAQVPLATITDVVRNARTELAGSPRTALPELVERLAMYRLHKLSADYPADRD